jgi:uncharacterized protein (TIGR03000 family)
LLVVLLNGISILHGTDQEDFMYKQRLFGIALVAAAALALLTPGQSQAWGWGRYGGWYGYGYPAYSYGYYYPGYSYYGYYPSYTYPYGYSPWYSYYGYPSYTYSYSYPSTYYYPASSSYAAAPQSGQYQSFYYSPDTDQPERRAHVEVVVPQNAEVWFDNHKTQQTGTDRFFVSPPIEPNYKYHYDIKARWMDNGRAVERDKKVTVQAGQQLRLDFTKEQPRTEERVTPPATGERPENAPAPDKNKPLPDETGRPPKTAPQR